MPDKQKSSRKFDADWVHKVKTDQVQKDWYDQLSPIGVSLILRVSRSGGKTWAARYRPQGESVQRRFKLGTYPSMTLAEARAKVSAIHAGLQEGADPAGKRRADREAMTFGKVAELYLERYAKVRKKSWQQDEWLLGKELLPAWEKKKAHLITKRDVIDLLHEIHDRPAPVLSNRTLALARKIFNWAIGQDLLKANPCDRVPAVGKESKRERVLTDDEIRKVWAALTDTKPELRINPLVADILKVMLITGQRKGEIERMRWADLDMDSAWWTIPDPKNKRSHRVPLSPMAMTILEARRSLLEAKAAKEAKPGEEAEVSPWVFPGHGTEGPVSETKKSIGHAQSRSGVDGWTPHDLRRTVASNLGRMGVSPSTIARCLNHKDASVPDVTWTYITYQFDAEKRQALDAWATRLAEILSPRQPAVLQVVVPAQSPATESQGSAERRRPTTPRRAGTRKAPSASPRP